MKPKFGPQRTKIVACGCCGIKQHVDQRLVGKVPCRCGEGTRVGRVGPQRPVTVPTKFDDPKVDEAS